MMYESMFPLLCALPVFLAIATPVQADEAASLKIIMDLGGKVEVDREQPDQPVVSLNLAGGNVTDADLKLLKSFKSLRSLGLNSIVGKSPPRANGRITDA